MIDPALRSLLPAEVAVVAGPVAALGGALWPEEQAAVARAVPKRVAEFTAGRVAARRALGHLGVTAGALARGPGGVVVWPAGTTGSLSHAGGQVAVAAARLGEVRGLGIDVEPVTARADDLVGTICAPAEGEAAAGWALGVLRVFSAKEAVFKALFPQVGLWFGFDAVEVVLEARGFSARVVAPLGPVPAGTMIEGGQAIAAEMVVSAVVLRGEMWRKRGADFADGNATFP